VSACFRCWTKDCIPQKPTVSIAQPIDLVDLSAPAAQVCIDVWRGIHKPAVLVAGNNDPTEELTEACRDWPQAHVLHGSD
jgi:hypothetical protein